ncbi:unnamed protein product [Microthlaspi erraticum]|uniref:Aldehyde oxidase/xanthine dehydrogenase second molybdopterin binding domain-containing protein n=1 Tax=Microthlaspi erraticum TaxID=1685480 RepID=A0A6D2IYJ0_9BRAS|nr:unnamed protein product [Microthlaspi erraticum]
MQSLRSVIMQATCGGRWVLPRRNFSSSCCCICKESCVIEALKRRKVERPSESLEDTWGYYAAGAMLYVGSALVYRRFIQLELDEWESCLQVYSNWQNTRYAATINDIPFHLNVSLLKGNPNIKAIHSSKAVGEPPFFLASSVFFAIKEAIKAARTEVGLTDWFPLETPATPERIRMEERESERDNSLTGEETRAFN